MVSGLCSAGLLTEVERDGQVAEGRPGTLFCSRTVLKRAGLGNRGLAMARHGLSISANSGTPLSWSSLCALFKARFFASERKPGVPFHYAFSLSAGMTWDQSSGSAPQDSVPFCLIKTQTFYLGSLSAEGFELRDHAVTVTRTSGVVPQAPPPKLLC